LEVEPRPRELQTDNNRIVRVVNVRQEKLKVLLVDGGPRYEYRYVKNLLERDPTIDLPCVDFGAAQVLLFPGESFVGYQRLAQQLAQRLRPDAFVVCIGYGECWPGYIPTQKAFDENFNHGWRWCGPASAARLEQGLPRLLIP
jgi:hypothetical protein